MKYFVKPENWDAWGCYDVESATVTDSMIADLAQEWEMTVEDLMDQVTDELSESEALAFEIRGKSEWDFDLLKQLCDMAGLSEEWDEADGENFESVAQRAADILGVEIQ